MKILITLMFSFFSIASAYAGECEEVLDPQLDCRNFNGYKPCGRGEVCNSNCTSFQSFGERIVVVHLEALGAVLRSTALLPAIKRQYPNSVITWVTKAPAHQLLAHNPYIDRVMTLNSEDLLKLKALEFDQAYIVDKSIVSAGLARELNVREVRGFVADSRNGAIVPANPEAKELWLLGLSNHQKFFVNKKTEIRLTHEALKLGSYATDDYQIFLSPSEQNLSDARRTDWSEFGTKRVIGINTGCSAAGVPFKKMSVSGQRELIESIQQDSRFRDANIVLLGGPEDTERNIQIGSGLKVIQSPTTLGLRDGLSSVAAVDAVFTGDSLGMHMAIGLKRRVVAWFGPTCAHEIELFGRGEALLSKATCGPCWKRSCDKPVMCYDQVNSGEVRDALARQLGTK